MKIFHWLTQVRGDCIADGYLLAENRAEAEEKLKLIPYNDKYEEVCLDDGDCGYDGCEINQNGITFRWCD